MTLDISLCTPYASYATAAYNFRLILINFQCQPARFFRQTRILPTLKTPKHRQIRPKS